MRILWMTLGLLIPNACFGWDEPCAKVAIEEEFAAQLVSIEASLSEGLLEASRASLSAVHKELLCMDQIVSTQFMSRLGTLFSIAFFFDQDDDASQRWLRGSKYAVSETRWPPVIEESHPLRDLEADLEWLFSNQENTGFLLPKKATLFISGRFVAKPTVPVETPLLVQVADRKGRVLSSWWQDGAAFPEDRLIAGGPALLEPSWWEKANRDRQRETPTSSPVPVAKAPEAVAEAPAPVAEAPAPVAEAAVTKTETPKTEPTQYVDPFQAARTRRILRERSERSIEGPEGQTTIVRTEIVSFVPDPSNGRPVTHQHYEQWLKDTPDWHKATAISRGEADDGYLTDWAGTRHPDGARKRPMVWVPFAAAKAYCESFGGELQTSTLQAADALDWEWRIRDEEAVRVSVKGKVKRETKPSLSYDDVGFRCKK